MGNYRKWIIVVVFACLGSVLFVISSLSKQKDTDTAEPDKVETAKVFAKEKEAGTKQISQTEKTSHPEEGKEQPDYLADWRQVIEDCYRGAFRNYIIRDDLEFRPYQGQTVLYRAYDLGNGYIRTEAELKEASLGEKKTKEFIEEFTYLFLEKDGEMELCVGDSEAEGKAKEPTKEELLWEGTLVIETRENIAFDDFEGKEGFLRNFENALCCRYFSDVKCDQSWLDEKPVFSEHTRAVKVWIMDFGVWESEALHYMVFTEEGYVYGDLVAIPLADGSFGRLPDGSLSIYEIPEAEVWLEDAESGELTEEKYEHFFRWFEEDGTVNPYTVEAQKGRVENFSRYYQFFKDHIIRCIELEEEED